MMLRNYSLSDGSNQVTLTSEEIRLIADLGFLAATNGLVVPGIRIFQSLIKLRKKHAFPYIGMAASKIFIGAYQSAIEVLLQAMDCVIFDTEEIALYLAVCAEISGDSESSKKISEYLIQNNFLSNQQLLLAQVLLKKTSDDLIKTRLPAPSRLIEFTRLKRT